MGSNEQDMLVEEVQEALVQNGPPRNTGISNTRRSSVSSDEAETVHKPKSDVPDLKHNKAYYSKIVTRRGEASAEAKVKLTGSQICARKMLALKAVLQHDLQAADLSWSLFSAACHSYRFDSILRPYPPDGFMKDSVKDIDGLRKIAECSPSMSVLQELLIAEEQILNPQIIDLLFWVLVTQRDPRLSYIPNSEHEKVMSLVNTLTPFTPPNHIFQVNYKSESSSERKFQELASQFGTKYGFHGSRLENFHSIIHHGLQVSMNKVAAFGPGIYLSSELSVSLPYSSGGYGWGASMFGSQMSIIALCEMVDHPDVKYQAGQKCSVSKKSYAQGSENGPVPPKYFIVQNSELVRVRYLLIYATEVRTTSGVRFRWIRNHKLITAIIGYVVILVSVGLKDSPVVQRLYRQMLKKLGL